MIFILKKNSNSPAVKTTTESSITPVYKSPSILDLEPGDTVLIKFEGKLKKTESVFLM